MKKTLIAAAVMAASGVAFAASNVTLYGVIEEGVVVSKAKHADTMVDLKAGFDSGNRWGIKGVEDLGNGYNVGFILEQGFTADNGDEGVEGKAFNRESILYVNGGFGSLAFGRIAVLCGHAEERGEHKHHDQQHRNDQMPCFAFCLHKIQGTSKSSSSADAAFISCCAALVGSSSAGWPSCRPFCDKTPLTAVRPHRGDKTFVPFRNGYSALSASSFSTTARRTQTHSSSEAVSTSSRLG